MIDYRFYSPDTDQKKQNIKVLNKWCKMSINNKKIPFKTVLMSSCYATERLMALIDNLGKTYYCLLKNNPARWWYKWRRKIQKYSRFKEEVKLQNYQEK